MKTEPEAAFLTALCMEEIAADCPEHKRTKASAERYPGALRL